MPTSYNGWSASESLATRPLVINGVAFAPGIRDDDAVATVLGYVAQQVADRVEKPVNPGCWGYSYRANRNDPTQLSNHSSGTAIDFNAPQHPNGIPTLRTWSMAQVTEIHKILAEVDYVVRWGGDYTITPDSMHFEINADRAAVAAVAARLGDDMFEDADRKTLNDLAKRVAQIGDRSAKRDLALKALIKKRFGATDDQLDEIFGAVSED